MMNRFHENYKLKNDVDQKDYPIIYWVNKFANLLISPMIQRVNRWIFRLSVNRTFEIFVSHVE